MEIIKSSAEITHLFQEGRRIGTPDLTLIVLPNEQHGHHGRAAFVAGKKLGNAVWRNRAKRRMRAICRDIGGPFPGWDVVFLARNRVTKEAYDSIVTRTRKALARAGIKYE